MNNISNEEGWKVIPSFPDYEASTLGKVRNKTTMKVIKFHENFGYMTSHLYRDQKRCPVKAHRLIAETFIENPESKEVVNHKNSIRNDNRVENLEWNTIKENNDHKLTKHPSNVKKYLRPVWQCNKDTKQRIMRFNSTLQAAMSINKDKAKCIASKIRCVVNGTRNTTYGYYWENDPYPVIEGEVWKEVTFIDNVSGYEVSSEGRLKNNKGTMFFGHKDDNGYIRVSVNEKLYRMHTLVARAFIPNPDNKPHVNHKDGVRDNNKLDNLEWVTRSENMQHAYDTGLNSNSRKNKCV
jgi:HNH endonuclease/NUMOD4 motif